MAIAEPARRARPKRIWGAVRRSWKAMEEMAKTKAGVARVVSDGIAAPMRFMAV